MYGTRARIGLLVPSGNTIIEPEFNALKPEGVSVHSARMFITHGTPEQLQRMDQETERATELVATARVDIVAFGCTTGSLVGGAGFDEMLVHRIEKVAHVPATTTSTAVLRAFNELGIRKAAIGTTYNDALNKLEADFFEAGGIRVLDIKGLDLTLEGMHQLPLEAVAQLAREVDRPDADGVFLSCTNLKAVPILDQLEKELRKPVFSSNVATFWDVMRMLGLKEPIKGHGQLLERL